MEGRALRRRVHRSTARSPARTLRRRAETLAALGPRLLPPVRRRIERERASLAAAGTGLLRGARHGWERKGGRLDALRMRLRALSPLAVLGRGYSLTRRAEDGRVVRRAADAAPGDRLRTRLSDGAHVDSVVEDVEPAVDA